MSHNCQRANGRVFHWVYLMNCSIYGWAGFIMAGFAASVSLLLRHWKSIEKWSAEEAPPQQQQQQRLQDLEQPLMSQA